MTTSLVTGGAGFIGSHLVEALLTAGRRVIVLDDLSTGAMANLDRVQANPQLRVVLDSIGNEELLARLIEEADEVYHLAAAVGVRLILDEPVRTVHTNTVGTEAVLRHLNGRHKPLFLASTSEVYGKNPKTPLAEDDDLVLGATAKGRWIYACSKALDEYLALGYHQQTGLPVVIGRFFNVVGPRQVGRYGMVLPSFVDQALAGGPLVVHEDGKQVRCFAHVADAVRGMMALLACPQAVGKVFNLGSDQPVTIRTLAETVRNVVDPALEITHIPYTSAFGSNFEDIRHRVPDLRRIRETIGYEPRHALDDIVREVVAWKRGQQATRAPAV